MINIYISPPTKSTSSDWRSDVTCNAVIPISNKASRWYQYGTRRPFFAISHTMYIIFNRNKYDQCYIVGQRILRSGLCETTEGYSFNSLGLCIFYNEQITATSQHPWITDRSALIKIKCVDKISVLGDQHSFIVFIITN